MGGTHIRDWLTRGALLLGFIALAVGVRAAHRTPATGYELSIYGATPTTFWIGVAIALTAALPVMLLVDRDPFARLSYPLAYMAVLSVLAVPLLRNYHFFGAGDSLSHLGYARAIEGGQLAAESFLYPGVHTASLLFEDLTGVALPRAFGFVVLLFFLVYLVFVPLCVWSISRGRKAVAVGAVAALLVLPLNNVSVHPIVHPSSQAILFTPFALFLMLRYTAGTDDTPQPTGAPSSDGGRRSATLTDGGAALPFGGTGTGILLALAGVAIILLHPQQALNVLIVLGVLTAVQLLARWRETGPLVGDRLLALQTGILAVGWIIWSVRHERVGASIGGVLSGLFGGSVAGDQVGQRSGSLAELGGSIPELFAKLFLVSAVFILLAGLVTYAVLRRWNEAIPPRLARRRYLVAALFPVGGLFAVFFVASVTTQYFRYLGFAMVLVTILGALALAGATDWLEGGLPNGVGRGLLVGVLLVAMGLQLMAAFNSPYIYQGNSQVTEMRLTGYETAFEGRDPTVAFVGIRGGPDRYVDEHYLPTSEEAATFPGNGVVIPPAVFNSNASSHYDSDRYLPVTKGDRVREVELYEGFRYSEAGFRSIETERGIDRVQSTGEFELYVLPGDDDGAPSTTGAGDSVDDAGASSTTGPGPDGDDSGSESTVNWTLSGDGAVGTPTATGAWTATSTRTATPTPDSFEGLNGTATTVPAPTATDTTPTGTTTPTTTTTGTSAGTGTPTATTTETPTATSTTTGTDTSTPAGTATPTATPDDSGGLNETGPLPLTTGASVPSLEEFETVAFLSEVVAGQPQALPPAGYPDWSSRH